ncbi:MAG: hypothetical protein RIT27_879 [Pseudomonadota bacterium]|jgi:hypothetical protein
MNDLKERALSLDIWLRGLLTLLFIFVFGITYWIILGVAFFQFGAWLITGETNERLQDFSESLTTYIYQITQYLTFNSEEKPFPFSRLPTIHHKSPFE